MSHTSARSVFSFIVASFMLAVTQAYGASGSAAGASASTQDREFVTIAAQGSIAEIETGKLAQSNGETDAVKQFGQRMVLDHGKANQELASIAKPLGITPPKETDAKHKAAAQKLAKMKGAEFDRAYGAQMVKDHEMTIALFEKQSKSGGNEALKQFATKHLPILQEHLKMARSLPGGR